MGKTVKTDNTNLAAKLDLRRHFLRKYHGDGPIHVLDCCQGEGLIWSRLRQEFELASYWAVDLKPKKGRLKLDSSRILAQPGWPQNVIDIDTYGSPWKHWEAMLPNVSQTTTVFLTIGQRVTGTVGRLSAEALAALGLRRLARILPTAFHVKLTSHATRHILCRANQENLALAEVQEAICQQVRNARYLGVRLKPIVQGNA